MKKDLPLEKGLSQLGLWDTLLLFKMIFTKCLDSQWPQCLQTPASKAELSIQQKSWGRLIKGFSKHLWLIRLQTKTWWHHPRHNPPRPLQTQPGFFQSPRDGFGEYILVKGTRMRGTWILPKDQMYLALWARQVHEQHVPFFLKTSQDHFRNWCPTQLAQDF